MKRSWDRPCVNPKACVGGISPFFNPYLSVTTIQGKFRVQKTVHPPIPLAPSNIKQVSLLNDSLGHQLFEPSN